MHTDPAPIPEEEDTVPPGDDSNDDPTPPLPAEPDPRAPERNPAVDTAVAANGPEPKNQPKKEESGIDHERDIPSDGRDPEGEGMVKEVDKPTEPSSDKPERE